MFIFSADVSHAVIVADNFLMVFFFDVVSHLLCLVSLVFSFSVVVPFQILSFSLSSCSIYPRGCLVSFICLVLRLRII